MPRNRATEQDALKAYNKIKRVIKNNYKLIKGVYDPEDNSVIYGKVFENEGYIAVATWLIRTEDAFPDTLTKEMMVVKGYLRDSGKRTATENRMIPYNKLLSNKHTGKRQECYCVIVKQEFIDECEGTL